jgi:ketosteroid isomerase-like protein
MNMEEKPQDLVPNNPKKEFVPNNPESALKRIKQLAETLGNLDIKLDKTFGVAKRTNDLVKKFYLTNEELKEYLGAEIFNNLKEAWMAKIEGVEGIAQLWLDAFNAHDLEKLLSLYDDNAEHYSPKLMTLRPETEGKIIGKEALRNWWQDAFDRLPTLKYEKISLIPEGEKVTIEYRRKVKGEEDMLVSEILEIESGKIIRSKVIHR